MRVAVVGSGVSGLVAAYTLAPRHEVVLFEAEARLGGHSHTVTVPDGDVSHGVDTGFIVFNTRTYPNFVRLLERLGVPSQPSDMSFSARSDARDFEYSGAGLNALYAQRRHLFSPRFHRMVRDILRFYREAKELLTARSEIPLERYLQSRGYSEAFIADHVLPLVGAVWSSSRRAVREFPARFFVRFFHNHGFLDLSNPPQWLTVPGGSQRYVRTLAASLRADVRTRAPIARISRAADGVLVTAQGQAPDRFDHVIVACHADQALSMLDAPSRAEAELLPKFRFQTNHVTLHTDGRLMPRRRRAWASWNYHLDDQWTEGASVTYWMNRLQALSGRTEYFVTLNRAAAIRPEHTLARFSYAHPIFTPEALEAQADHDALIGHDRISYCGAYWRNGFHEDGVASALRACAPLGGTL